MAATKPAAMSANERLMVCGGKSKHKAMCNTGPLHGQWQGKAASYHTGSQPSPYFRIS